MDLSGTLGKPFSMASASNAERPDAEIQSFEEGEIQVMNNQKRIGAGILCIVFVLAMLVPSVFIIHEAGHDCIGEDCPICQAIATCSQLLRVIGVVILILATLLGILSAQRAWNSHAYFVPAFGTLVSWKIRLNN